MHTLSEHQLLNGLLSLGSILLVGRGMAEVAKRFGQPEVLGELIGGFLIGPSIIGAMLPELHHHLFSDPGVGMALSLFGWTGAILLLIVAGAEVDLTILIRQIKPGSLAAAFTVIPSIAAGTAFGLVFMQMNMVSAIFFGAVFSVTAVSVIAKILIERKTLRRSYAQVIMAAGIASEVIVWPIVSALSAIHNGDDWLTGVKTTLYAIAFFATMLTVGQRFVNWIMRRIADVTTIIYGQLSLLVVLGFFFAGITEILGLHPLLGPFVFGVLIGRAPRATSRLKESIHAVTLSVFAPVFFVMAGMRVDISKLENWHALALTLGICFAAMATKVAFGFIGGKLGGLRNWESVIVGLGANMRGGTDVIVAILGGSLGIISEDAYSMYAMAAIFTVLISPPMIAALERYVPPTDDELKRLSKEEARRRAYLSGVERVLLPTFPDLHPSTCVPLLRWLALSKEMEGEVFDIAELAPDAHTNKTQNASDSLKELSAAAKTEYSHLTGVEAGIFASILEVSKQVDLVVIGAAPNSGRTSLSFGHVQDSIIDGAMADVLVIANGNATMKQNVKKILVPINGMEYSMAAADIAGYIAKATEAELVLLNVVSQRKVEEKSVSRHAQMRSGLKILQEAKFRTRRLDVQCQEKVLIAENVADEIIAEIKRGRYDLVMLGVVDRSADAALHLGGIVERLQAEVNLPIGILAFHDRSASHESV
ncbi:MAG: cation:proton antiporter [Candidatus Obscuribacterales bacterium]|nr:cation:proton antiporter [Candidatus Obscuribacterales bacterium]